MKQYIMTVEGARTINLRESGRPPLWSLNFTGTVTREQAMEEAYSFLRRRSERVVEKFCRRVDSSGGEATWEFILNTAPMRAVAE